MVYDVFNNTNTDGFFLKNQSFNNFTNFFIDAVNSKKTGIKSDRVNNIYFTDKQSAVLKLLCKGYTNKEISEKLFVSTRQMERHKKIFEEFKVKNEKEAILKAIKFGYIVID